MCMEQEIVRFHAMSAYSSFNNGPPPGVCAALCWQNMSQQQLKVEVGGTLFKTRPAERGGTRGADKPQGLVL